MDCKQLIQYLSDFIDQDLDEQLAEEAREHLSTCSNCHVVLNSTQQTILLYRERGDRQRIPAERRQTLFSQLAQAFAANAHHQNAADEDCDEG